jgi:hypothetical protein
MPMPLFFMWTINFPCIGLSNLTSANLVGLVVMGIKLKLFGGSINAFIL